MNAKRVDYQTVLQTVHRWPVNQRVALIQDILGALLPDTESAPPHRKNTLPRAIGLLRTEHPAPTDAEVETWLAAHRLEKYGR